MVIASKAKGLSNEIKVLVVDDQVALTKNFYDQYFKRKKELNLVFEFSGNGVDALRKIEKTEFAIIITDIRMPEMDGMTLLKRLKEMGRKIPSIVLTAYGTEKDRVEARELGAVRVFEKPTGLSVILTAIQEVLAELE